MRRLPLVAVSLAALISPSAAAANGTTSALALNHIQAVGTHNSYHLEASPAESAIRRGAGFDDSPLAYSHVSLTQQLTTQHVRQIELDLFADPQGGRYASPRLRGLAGEGAYDPTMREPGTKVLHIQDYDYRANCLTLVRCLSELRAWSRANPGHVPVAVLLELKDLPLPPGLGATVPLAWTRARMDAVDAEIRSVFSPREMIVPDDVRRGRSTLRAAIVRRGWPALSSVRGKVMFLMDNREPYRSRYLTGHPSLAGRVLFTNSAPWRADAAFIEHADPRGRGIARIRRLVKSGFMVRTRADADTVEARANDRRRARRALRSGAHWVSTDYPARGMAERFGSPYFVALPGGAPARCNPVTAPYGCHALVRG